MPQFLSGNIASRTVSATRLIHNSFVKRIARELILTANLLTSCFFCLVLGIPVGLSLGVRVMPPTKSINAPNILFMSGDLYVGRRANGLAILTRQDNSPCRKCGRCTRPNNQGPVASAGTNNVDQALLLYWTGIPEPVKALSCV